MSLRSRSLSTLITGRSFSRFSSIFAGLLIAFSKLVTSSVSALSLFSLAFLRIKLRFSLSASELAVHVFFCALLSVAFGMCVNLRYLVCGNLTLFSISFRTWNGVQIIFFPEISSSSVFLFSDHWSYFKFVLESGAVVVFSYIWVFFLIILFDCSLRMSETVLSGNLLWRCTNGQPYIVSCRLLRQF